MADNIKQKTISNDRIKLPITFDAKKLFEDYKALELEDFIYHNAIQLRAPAFTVDTTLPHPPPAVDYADGSWTDWLNTDILNKSPFLLSIVNFFQEHTDVTSIRLLRLAPTSVVKEHTDPTLSLEEEKSVIRLTIPIYGSEYEEFYLNGSLVEMKPGECWYLRLSDPHKIVNKGEMERVNLTIDLLPNQWVRELIKKSQ